MKTLSIRAYLRSKDSDKDSTPYRYNILPKDSIRVLLLLPGNRSAPLQCELYRAAVPGLDSPGGVSGPAFEALSYAWGDANPCQKLFCNNSVIKITQSLFDALIHLRYRKATRTLWVDAVCIDQNNNDEKIEQLPHMKDIYQHASHVVIWLGLAEESSGRALDLIRLAAKCLRQESGQRMPTQDSALRFKEPFSDNRNRQWGFPPKEDLKSWPVAALFERSWFFRCWTFQEAALARKATIQIGAHLLDWADLCVACNFFFYKGYGAEAGVLGKNFFIVMSLCWPSRIARGLQEWIPLPLLPLLVTTINTQATLPTDRIFGVLALAEGDTQKYFWPSESVDSPKYNMSIRELYTDVARFLLRDDGRRYGYPLDLLSHVKHYPLEQGEQEKRIKDDGGLIPSWAKRWHTPEPEFKLDREGNTVQPSDNITDYKSIDGLVFRTGGPKFHAPECNPQTPYEISLHGFIFAPISITANIFRRPLLSRSRLWDFILEIRSVREERHALYPTGESVDEAFALTLTMASKPRSRHEPETYHATDFQTFCVWFYEKSIPSLKRQGRVDDIERLRTEWEVEYERLKSLVGEDAMCPAFWADLQLCCVGRKLFSTASGHIGIGNITLEPGDLVCVFLGARTPFIVRPVGEKYEFVGDCYLHGIMQGEALEEGLKRRQLITLI